MSRLTASLAVLLATASPLPAIAQEVEPAPAPQLAEPVPEEEAPAPVNAAESGPPAVAEPEPTELDEFMGEDEGEVITVTGARPRGSVVGDIPAENVLSQRDIRSTGATSISELLDAVSAQTGSARGRSGGRPILLLNGRRISGFREMRDLPPEAIERMEILPEEVALKYGYAADQRVVNIVLRRRFNSTSIEAGGAVATDGDYASGRAEATRLAIRDDTRTSLNLRVEGNDPLYESDRGILLDPTSALDQRDARTLVGAQQSARLTGTLARPIGETATGSITAEVGRSRSRSRFGLADFDPTDTLTRESQSDNLAIGSAINADAGKWRLSTTASFEADMTKSESERSLVTALRDDRSESTRTSAAIDGTATGPLFSLPAGEANVTAKVGLSRLDLDSEARRRDIFTGSDLGRTKADASASFDLPITKRASKTGRIGLNLNAGLSQLSDFGTLTSLGAGVNWAPTTKLNFIGSFTREEGAPSLQQLGDPLVETANIPFFDAITGQTVNVTTLTGGNPALDADRRTVWKLGSHWQPLDDPDLRLRAEYVHERIDNPQIGFPAATPALEAAFPGRFVRDGAGQLVSVDLRPVNADRSTRDTIRWGFDFSKSLRSARPTREQIQTMRQRMQGQSGGTTPPPPPPGDGSAAPPAEGAQQGGFRGGGRFGGGGGGRFGGRNGGRINFSLTHTLTLTDELDIAPGLPTLDYLDGEAVSSLGGRPRHQVEAQGGYYNNGLGARLSANWRSGTRVDGTAGDIRFGDYATFDLRLFANLGERFDLVSKNPFFLGSSVRFEVKNIFNARPEVRGADGLVPLAYQADRLEPIGRTIGISFRKLFLPRRLMQRGGGGGAGGRGD
jgi:outer membrane cobalamin receptor